MHDPGEHSSPVRLPFGSFPVINILLSHTDYLYRLTAPRVLCSICFRVAANYASREVSNYDSEQDHQPERGSRLYGIFSKNVFLSGYFRERKENRIFAFATKLRKFIFLFPWRVFL